MKASVLDVASPSALVAPPLDLRERSPASSAHGEQAGEELKESTTDICERREHLAGNDCERTRDLDESVGDALAHVEKELGLPAHVAGEESRERRSEEKPSQNYQADEPEGHHPHPVRELSCVSPRLDPDESADRQEGAQAGEDEIDSDPTRSEPGFVVLDHVLESVFLIDGEDDSLGNEQDHEHRSELREGRTDTGSHRIEQNHPGTLSGRPKPARPLSGELFAGVGGLGMAIDEVFGSRPAWFCEFDAAPSKVLAHHFPDVPNYGDVRAVDFRTVPHTQIGAGGFPCQDVSLAGRRRGMTDGTRSGLWSEFARSIEEDRPDWVVIENVRGLLSADATSDMEPCPLCVGDNPEHVLRALGAVLGDLAELGFDAEWVGLRASDVGAPHGRFRVFVLAWPRERTATHDDRTGLRGVRRGTGVVECGNPRGRVQWRMEAMAGVH